MENTDELRIALYEKFNINGIIKFRRLDWYRNPLTNGLKAPERIISKIFHKISAKRPKGMPRA